MKYIKKDVTGFGDILKEIEELVGKTRIRIKSKNGELIELDVEDKNLSPTTKTKLQIIFDTLEK